MNKQLAALEQTAAQAVAAAAGEFDLQQAKARFLGRKGELTAIMKEMGTLPPEQRPVFGAQANAVKERLETLFEERLAGLRAAELQRRLVTERVDVTLPGRRPRSGSKHPLSQVTAEIVTIFAGLGFGVAEGPEVERDFYNFEALNMPRDHPARDMQDTFYISDDVVLRTHTSPVQVRVMEKTKPPLKIIAPGT